MIWQIMGAAVVVLVYICLFIIVFSPTLYAVWFYVISRQVAIKRKGLLRVALTTFCINSIIAYFLMHFAVDFFLVSKIAEKDALAGATVRSAVVSQQQHFAKTGRYYPVGPIRGPYQDDHGLVVGKDVILYVLPRWDKGSHKETFEAYALHVWGRSLMTAIQDGKAVAAAPDSPDSDGIRQKLVDSVK